MLKKEIRVVGIDDCPFNKFKDTETLIVGAVFRGGSFLDGLVSATVHVDGDDATDQIISMINKSKYRSQLRVIFLNGIAVGGFNVIDTVKIYNKTKIPVVVVIRRMPDIENIRKTLEKLGMSEKYSLIEKAGDVKIAGKVYCQLTGISLAKAKEILALTTKNAFVPEPLRAAHLIASGIGLGESKSD